MDPLSITTGVLSVLGVCYTVGTKLKKIRDDVGSVNSVLHGMLGDVEALAKVLDTMRATFDEIPAQMTGHIGTHWKNIYYSLEDGKFTLNCVLGIIERISQDVSFMNKPRKLLRLNDAEEELAELRKRLQSFRDTVQLSMQALILWNQVTMQSANELILPSLDQMQKDIRRLANLLNNDINSLQETTTEVNIKPQELAADEIAVNKKLRNCVQSAATIVSSASTLLNAVEDQETVHGSEFGDIFPTETTDSTLEWLSSCELSSSKDENGPEPPLNLSKNAGDGKTSLSSPLAQVEQGYQSDSDLDADLTEGLYKKGVAKFREGDRATAEPILNNCLTRLRTASNQHGTTYRQADIPIARAILNILFEIYAADGRLDEAVASMTDKIALSPQGLDSTNEAGLKDMSRLVDALYQQEDWIQSHLYCRKLLRAYRKLGSSKENDIRKTLELLVNICKASGNDNEAEAYAAMLEDIPHERIKPQSTPVSPAIQSSGNEADHKGLAIPIRQEPSAVYRSSTPFDNHSSNQRGVVPPFTMPSIRDPNIDAFYAAKRAEGSVPKNPSMNIRDEQYKSTVAPESTNVREAPLTGQNSAIKTQKSVTKGSALLHSRNYEPHKPYGYSDMLHLVLFGDSGCGKSLLLHHMALENVDQTINDQDLLDNVHRKTPGPYYTSRTVAEQKIEYWMRDTQCDRSGRYNHYDGVTLIVFSKDNPGSLFNAMTRWKPAISAIKFTAPILLVGNKKDLEHDSSTAERLSQTSQHMVTYQEGLDMAERMGAIGYLECSARTGEGIEELLEFTALYGLKKQFVYRYESLRSSSSKLASEKKEKKKGWFSRLSG